MGLLFSPRVQSSLCFAQEGTLTVIIGLGLVIPLGFAQSSS
jgi:hypothetical protein